MRLHVLLESLFREKWWSMRADPIDADAAEREAMLLRWNRWLDGREIKRLKMSEVESYGSLFINQATPEGDFYVWNPAAKVHHTERVLLVPKDTAEKLIFLGAP